MRQAKRRAPRRARLSFSFLDAILFFFFLRIFVPWRTSFPAEATQRNPSTPPSCAPVARLASHSIGAEDPRPLGPKLLGVRHYLVSEG